MSTPRSNFPDEIWDGHSLTQSDPKDDKLDFRISDQHASEIRAIEAYIIAYVEILRLLGNPNTVIGVNAAGTALEYKELVEGSNVTIDHSAGAIQISASGGGDTPYAAEVDSDVEKGQPLYVLANTHVDLAEADDVPQARVAGIANEDAVATTSVDYLTEGRITKADWTGVTGTALLTPGAVYYLGGLGLLTTIAPTSGFIVSCGRAINTTTFDIEISPPIRL